MTAPYSPSQNGATKCLNRMLIKLARAMMIAQDVPHYLWEYAVQHAMYICERAPAAALAGKTPYETWYGAKPDVTHLCKFGGPVYILLQGANKQLKLQPKSQKRIFLGFDEGSKAIKYYTGDTKQVLTVPLTTTNSLTTFLNNWGCSNLS